MTYRLISGHTAIAWGARLALVNYIPGFAVTPAIEIINILSNWINQGEMTGSVSIQESESAMLNDAASAADDSQRVFAVTTGEHLVMAFDLMKAASNKRVPMVLFNLVACNQSDKDDIPDHDKLFNARDSGFIQFCCTSFQEILDTILLAYRLAEDESVRMPVLINLDQQRLNFGSERVNIPNHTAAKQFIGSSLQALPMSTIIPLDPESDESGVTGLTTFRYSTHFALRRTLEIYDDLAEEFRDFFGRYYPPIDDHACGDAEYIFILAGTNPSHADKAITELRAAGWSVGILRPRLLRPFPKHRLSQLLLGKRAVAVIDSYVSPGEDGVLYSEIISVLNDPCKAPPIVASFLIRPENQPVNLKQFMSMATTLQQAADTGITPPPSLLSP